MQEPLEGQLGSLTQHAPAGTQSKRRRTIIALLLFALVFEPLLLGLGFWQLRRAAEKQQWLIARAAAERQPGLQAADLNAFRADWIHRPAQLSGRYSMDRQWLLDNRTNAGRIGYEVLTPLQLEDGRWLLVDRGWVQAPPHREQLPSVSAPAGPVTVLGDLEALAGQQFVLSDAPAESGWPKRIERIDPEQLQQQFGQSLLPWRLMLAADQPGVFTAVKESLGFGPERHRGYAVQWFGLALVLLIGVIVAIRKSWREASG